MQRIVIKKCYKWIIVQIEGAVVIGYLCAMFLNKEESRLVQKVVCAKDTLALEILLGLQMAAKERILIKSGTLAIDLQ